VGGVEIGGGERETVGVDVEAGVGLADSDVGEGGGGVGGRFARFELVQAGFLVVGGALEVVGFLLRFGGFFGSAPEVFEASAFVAERGGAFAEFGVGLVD